MVKYLENIYSILLMISQDEVQEESIIVTNANFREIADNYNSMFSALCLISEENPSKLGIHDNKLYKSWDTFGGLQRTYYRESRSTLMDFLENNFQKYVSFYNNMFNLLSNKRNALLHEIATTIEVSKLNINLWIRGLNGVKYSYPDDKSVLSKIDIIISMLTSILSKKVSLDD